MDETESAALIRRLLRSDINPSDWAWESLDGAIQAAQHILGDRHREDLSPVALDMMRNLGVDSMGESWTPGAPTEPGDYWVRFDDPTWGTTDPCLVVRLCRLYRIKGIDTLYADLEHYGGAEWVTAVVPALGVTSYRPARRPHA